MIAISASDLTLRFGTVTVLENITFSLEENDKLGIIGVNGCGKSSLFKMISGEYEPENGQVYIAKGKTVGILSQEGAFDASMLAHGSQTTAIEEMYLAFPHFLRAEERLAQLEQEMANEANTHRDALLREYTDLHERYIRDGGLEFRGRCASILQKLGFDEEMMNQSVATLSGGQRTRLALSVQLSREPDILMLDEPTNHLDMDTTAWLESFLVSYKKCVLVISHDRYFLDRVTNKTLAIQNHHAKLYRGGYTTSMEQRCIDRELAKKHYRDQQKEIAHQEAYIAQQRQWNRERNIVAAESRQKLLDKMEKLERPESAPKPISMKFSSGIASGNDVLTLDRLGKSFGGKKLFDDVSCLVKKGDRLLIIGPNGCGKSTLVKIIIGKLEPDHGSVEAGYHVEVGYYDQENQNLTPENTVLDELWNAYPRLPEVQIRSTLALFRFTGEDVFKTVSVLSGGERARLTLSKLILSKMNVLILDEPTNHLDIDSREALEGALESFEGTVITVSHDRYFINKLATRILEMKPGPAFPGDTLDFHVDKVGDGYSEYRAYKEAREAERKSTESDNLSFGESASGNKEQYLKKKSDEAQERKKKNRRERLQREAEALEEELKCVERDLFGDAATDYKKAALLDTRKTEIENRLLEIYEEIE